MEKCKCNCDCNKENSYWWDKIPQLIDKICLILLTIFVIAVVIWGWVI
jgi:hypothetical protein